MANFQNYMMGNNKKYHERADATVKISEKDIITARYKWAIKIFSSRGLKKIIDIGCGLGFGTNLLALSGFDVEGIDISEQAIEVCKQRYPRISFSCATVDEVVSESYDGAVAFEVIEHLDEVSQYKFLCNCARILTDEGILLITTPNRKYFKNRNPHHLRELFYADLRVFFKGAKIEGRVLPHIRKFLSLFIDPQKLDDMHLPIFRVPVHFAEYFFIEIDKLTLLENLKALGYLN